MIYTNRNVYLYYIQLCTTHNMSVVHSFISAAAVTNDYCIALKKVTGRKKECRL